MSVTTTSVLPSGTWVANPVTSSATFSVRHMAVSTFRGRFDDVQAQVDGDAGTITGRVAVASIDVKDPNLAGHLSGPEFFDADLHPEITFESVAVRGTREDLVVEGDLTVKGITRRVEARGSVTEPAEDPFGGVRVGLRLEAVIDRREVGLRWNQQLPKGGWALGNDVTLSVELELSQG